MSVLKYSDLTHFHQTNLIELSCNNAALTNEKAEITKFQKKLKNFLLFFIRHWCTQPDWISAIVKHFVKTKVFRTDESFCQQTQKNEDATFHLVDETRWDRKILDPWMLRALRGGQSIEFLLPKRGLRYDRFVKKIHFQGHFSKNQFCLLCQNSL